VNILPPLSYFFLQFGKSVFYRHIISIKFDN